MCRLDAKPNGVPIVPPCPSITGLDPNVDNNLKMIIMQRRSDRTGFKYLPYIFLQELPYQTSIRFCKIINPIATPTPVHIPPDKLEDAPALCAICAVADVILDNARLCLLDELRTTEVAVPRLNGDGTRRGHESREDVGPSSPSDGLYVRINIASQMDVCGPSEIREPGERGVRVVYHRDVAFDLR